MFYLFTKSILIEIGLGEDFYIADKKFDSLPNEIISNSYSSANWNRALKYQIESECVKTIYNMIDIDVYWNTQNNRIEFLTKSIFWNAIVNDKHFWDTFSDRFFNHYFKHTIVKSQKDINKEFIVKYKPTIRKDIYRITNIDNYLITNFDEEISKRKFKNIWTVANENFSWEVNKMNQIIYKIPNKIIEDLEITTKSDFVNFECNDFLINTRSNINDNLILELCVNSKKESEIIVNRIIETVSNSSDELKNWHLFNLTKNPDFLKKEITRLKSESKDLEDSLKQIYSILKRNYDLELKNLI